MVRVRCNMLSGSRCRLHYYKDPVLLPIHLDSKERLGAKRSGLV